MIAGGAMTAVLGYHDVAPPAEFDSVGFSGGLAARYKLEPGAFDAHLEALLATGLSVGLVGDGAMPAVAMTFDDGGRSAPEIAGALQALGWRGHFFVTTGMIGRPGFVGADEIRELRDRGHLVGSHSHSHPTLMGKLEPDEIEDEWRRSMEVLGGILGEVPTHASVPGGFLSRPVIELAERAGYHVLMTSEPVTRVETVGRMRVIGRLPIRATTSPGAVAAMARGSRIARARISVPWAVKRGIKAISPTAFDALRRLRGRGAMA